MILYSEYDYGSGRGTKRLFHEKSAELRRRKDGLWIKYTERGLNTTSYSQQPLYVWICFLVFNFENSRTHISECASSDARKMIRCAFSEAEKLVHVYEVNKHKIGTWLDP